MEKVTSRVRDIVGQRPSRRFIEYSTRVDGLWCCILVDGQAFQPVVTPYLSYTIYPSAGATLKFLHSVRDAQSRVATLFLDLNHAPENNGMNLAELSCYPQIQVSQVL